jgi:hypothetical protein
VWLRKTQFWAAAISSISSNDPRQLDLPVVAVLAARNPRGAR